jgi:hypothetical protein
LQNNDKGWTRQSPWSTDACYDFSICELCLTAKHILYRKIARNAGRRIQTPLGKSDLVCFVLAHRLHGSW